MSSTIKQSWFRMYAEFATDPKVQMLSEIMQRRYIMLLCLRCNGDVTLHETEIAFQLRISNDDMEETKQCLMDKGLVDKNLNPANWDKRQFVSDSSAARVKKHRQAKKEGMKQPCNVTVTKCNALDTDTDTDTYKRKDIKEKPILKDVAKAKPDKPTSIPDNFQPSAANQAYAKKHGLDIGEVLETLRNTTAANGKTYVNWHGALGTYLQNAKKWAAEKQVVQTSPVGFDDSLEKEMAAHEAMLAADRAKHGRGSHAVTH